SSDLVLMISSVNDKQLIPFGKMSVGYNTGGILFRMTSGIKYYLTSDFILHCGIEYSNLFYTSIDSRNANSQKINLVYGLAYQF
ncbi:MAG: hypothetical protein QG635_2034, partial [Bacteroidota bacterium]|nr:hypothetical protein [Bacteroidota bacterium]